MTNSITFDELNILDSIESTLELAFKTDESQVTNYWFNLFGKKDMKIVKENYGVQTDFPILVVEILNPIPYLSARNSKQIEQYTQFDFEINHYNKAVKKLNKRTIGIMINNRIKYTLQQNNFNITSNLQVASADDTIYRRVISGNVVYNNTTGLFYQV